MSIFGSDTGNLLSGISRRGLAAVSRPLEAGLYAALACSLILLSGCASGYRGLPPGLPIPGTPGIIPAPFPPSAPPNNLASAVAVAGRSFSEQIIFSGGTAPFTCMASGLPVNLSISASATILAGGFEACVISSTGNLPGNEPLGANAVTVTLTDSSSPSQMGTFSFSLTVNPALTAGAYTLANGVNGRAYTQNVSVPVTGGTGVAPYSCMVNGLPFDGLSSTPGAGTATNCTFTINGPATAAGTTSVTVSAMDSAELQNGNTVVPAGTSAPSGTANNLVIRQEYAFTGVPASFPNGVVGRPYGTAAGTSPQVLTTNVSATMGNAPLAMCAVASGAGGNPFVEAVMGGTNCALTSSAVLTNAGALTLMISATDTPIPDPTNGAIVVVPAKTQTASVNLTVAQALALALDAASASITPPPTAVQGRSYGNKGAGFKDLAFDASQGLPPYIFGLPASVATPAANGVPATVTCTATSATVAECTSGASTITAATGAYPFSLSVNDTANAATPSASASGTQPAPEAATITVVAALSFTESGLALTGGPPTATLPNAVTGRTYAQNGAGPPAQLPLKFTVAGGTGVTPTLASAPGGGITCTYAAPVLTCHSNPTITTAGGGNITFAVTATDAANASVPAGNSTTDTAGNTMYMIPVNNALSFSENYGTTAALPDAVQGRTYGSGSNNCFPTSACADVIFTGAGGLAPYTFTETGALPATIACPSASPLHCKSAGNVTGAPGSYPFTISVVDAGNAAVPQLSPALMMDTNGNSGFSITVDATFTLTPPARIPNALVGFPYPAGVTFTETGGTTVNDSFVFGTAAAGTCTASASPPAPPGISIGMMSGMFTGTGTVASSTLTDYTFNVCVSDTGNFSTPGGAVQSASILLNELNPLAAAAGTGSSSVEVFNYVTNAFFTSISLAGGTATPSGIAVAAGGARFFVADNANNTIIELSSIDGSVLQTLTLSSMAPGCGSPTEMATTPDPASAGFNRLYVVCTDTGGAHVEEVAVFNLSTPVIGAAIAEIPTGAGSSPAAVAIQGNNSHAFVTLNGFNQIFVIDNTGAPTPVTNSPFNLDPMTDQPTGIAVTAQGGSVYAYIGKQGFGNQPTTPSAIATLSEAGNTVTATTTLPNGFANGETVVISGATVAGYNGTWVITFVNNTTFTYTDPTAGLAADNSGTGTATLQNQQGIEVVDVSAVDGGGGAATLVTDILLTAGALPNPDDVAVDPTNSFVYVTLPGTNQFAMLTNTATPAQVSGPPGPPFNLPDPLMAATDTPGGVAVPPVTAGTIHAYFTAMNMDAVDVINQTTPPTVDLTITGLTAGSAPGRVKFIPIPK